MSKAKEISAKLTMLAEGNRNLAEKATMDLLVTFFEGNATAYAHAAEIVEQEFKEPT